MRGLVPCRDGAGGGRGGQGRRSESLWFSDSLQKELEGPCADRETEALRG